MGEGLVIVQFDLVTVIIRNQSYPFWAEKGAQGSDTDLLGEETREHCAVFAGKRLPALSHGCRKMNVLPVAASHTHSHEIPYPC